MQMQLFRNLTDVRLNVPTILTIGTFDGLHRGHQDIIRQLKSAARAWQASTAVIAFHPRPKAVFSPHRFHNDYLTTPDERIALLENIGVDVLILTPFTLEFSQTTAHDFMRMMVNHLNLRQLCVGHDFALGKDRAGNIVRLAELGKQLNYSVCEIEPFTLDGKIVSSTQIRHHLTKGKVRQAAYLLGRYPSLTSQVTKGAQRGRTIGFPTANLLVPAERLLPENGVYATFVQILGQDHYYPSVTNVGVRPSFDGRERTVETHIFDFDQNIYNKTVNLEFVERLRVEKKFNNINALVAQIKDDAKQAKALLIGEIETAT